MLLPYLSGNTETSSASELISYYRQNEATGSLWLEHNDKTTLLLFNQGKVVKDYSLTQALDIEENQVSFIFYQHDMRGHIELPSRFPGAVSAVMRSLPKLSEEVVPEPVAADVQTLLADLAKCGYSGYVCVENSEHKGLILLKQGEILVALYESEQNLEEADDALRLIRRARLEFEDTTMSLRPLAPALLEGLLALYKGNASHGLHIFNGLESSEEGYAFFKDGRALIRTHVELVGLAAYFPHVMEESQSLQMPDEPLGWETKHYLLTLRGKDSLNAITELAMNFERSFGEEGKRVLRLLANQQTPISLAEALSMNLGDVKPIIDSLEQDGLIRHVTKNIEL